MLLKKIIFIIICFQIFLYSDITSQIIEHNIEKLPAVMPNCILQDKFGFIWFGDQEGLVKYDGYNLKRFKQIPFDTTSLSNNFVFDIKEDSLGNLWIATRGGGLNYFDQRTERFKHYRNNPEAINSLGSNDILNILVEDNGSLWVSAFPNGFTHITWDSIGNPIYKRFPVRNPAKDLVYYTVLEIYKDKNGLIWIGSTGMGLQCLNPESGEIKTYRHDPKNEYSINHNFVSSICEDDSGNLIIGTGFWFTGTGGGLSIFDKKTKKFIRFKHDPQNPNTLSSDVINSLHIDNRNVLWIGTSRGGINYISLKDLYNKKDPNFKKALTGTIAAIYEDRAENIWIAPHAFYLYRLETQSSLFSYLKHELHNLNSLNHSSAYSLYLDNQQNLWVGHTKNGTTCINLKTKHHERLTPNPQNLNSISSSKIASICEDKQGRIWFGTSLHGIDIYDPGSGKFTHITSNLKDSTTLANNYVRHLLKRPNGDIWVFLEKDGIQLYNSENHAFINLDTQQEAIEKGTIYSMFEDRSGKLWLGSANNGLYAITLNGKEIQNLEHYSYNAKNKNGINNNVIGDILQDREKNILWLTTNCGLNRFDMDTGLFSHITENEGFATNFLLTLLQDNSDNLWITTSEGLSRYDPKTGEIINFDKKDGLPHTSFGGGSRRNVKTIGDTLYFGALGVIAFDPKNVQTNQKIPQVRFTDFKVFHKSVSLDTSILLKNKITLDNEQSVFSLDFSALNFTNPNKNLYKYKMEGFNKDWIHIGNNRRASFTNLDPGKYTFRVKGSNNHGIWNEEGTSIKVIITPPWWATWWFRTIIVLLILGILYWIFKSRTSALKKKHLAQKEFSRKLIDSQEKERKRIATALHDSHGQNLLIISNEMQQYVEKHKESKNELKNIIDTVQESINEIREISYDLHPHILERVGIEEAIDSMISKISKSTDIQFDLISDEVDNVFDKKVEINIYRIIQEAVNNIIKHSQATEAKIEINKHRKYVNILISDNGIGFDKRLMKKENNGLGLEGMKERVNLINGKYKLKSEQGRGTTVEIKIPFKA